jgi:hypothetical protein
MKLANLTGDKKRGFGSKMAQLGAFPLICASIDVMLAVYWPSTNYHFVPYVIWCSIFLRMLLTWRSQCIHIGQNVCGLTKPSPSVNPRLQVHEQSGLDFKYAPFASAFCVFDRVGDRLDLVHAVMDAIAITALGLAAI